ncbi:MAG: tetratricopeptide repeat protein [Candidatus Kryptoniota bacterium]
MKDIRLHPAVFVFLFMVFSMPALAQVEDAVPGDSLTKHSNSSVFRDYQSGSTELVQPSDLGYQLWEELTLVRKANGGDPEAQQELGSRYFFGNGFPVDTARAAYWIHKAADQNMPIGQYNFGIFLNNGWGVNWNPFEAYNEFKAAAAKSLPEAEFAVGISYTDNLIVPLDLAKAYKWIKAAADAKYEPALEVLPKLISRMKPAQDDSIQSAGYSTTSARNDSSFSAAAPSQEPIFLAFGPDTTSRVSDLTLLNEAFREGNEKFKTALGVSDIFSTSATKGSGSEQESEKDSTAITMIVHTAEAGSPEALIVLGRCFELGIGFPRDRILAAEQYLRASRLDSRRAPMLLLSLVRQNGFLEEVESRCKKGGDDAAFVWAGLTELGLDQRLDYKQAFHLLQIAADHGNIPSLIELGRCYYTGQWTARNPVLGRRSWLRAAEEGSSDAEIRLAAAAVLSDSGAEQASLSDTIQFLSEASNDGSIVGQLALGYCFEKGIGVTQNTPEAVRLYRNCAERGSESGYDALKRMYDDLRPKDKEFDVEPDSTNAE